MTKHSTTPLRFEESYTNPSSLRGWDTDLLPSRPLPSDYVDDMNELVRSFGFFFFLKKKKKEKEFARREAWGLTRDNKAIWI